MSKLDNIGAKTFGRVRKQNIVIGQPGKKTKVFKAIEKALAVEREQEMRSRCIQSARYIRDSIADNAPKRVYRDILLGEPLEKYYNKNSGYDVKLDAGATLSFVLKVSVNRFASKEYKGYNPVFGLIVSNYGRKPITHEKGIPIPTDRTFGRRKGKKYNHPEYGTGYGGRYEDKYVVFPKKVRGVQGDHWIENGVRSAQRKAYNLLAGIGSYKRNKDKDRYWA